MTLERFKYDDDIVKKFIFATLFWGVIGVLIGLLAACQLTFRQLNFDTSFLTYGRMRTVHTNAIIFAFCLNGIFAGIYHSSQRLLKTRMYSDFLSRVHFWGWQIIIVLAAVTLLMGYTTSKEYAELEWPIAILIAIVWVLFAINYFLTIKVRREKVLYVSIWFYVATIITIALLHIVNHLALPVSFWKSYPVYSGVRDALVQWWYGHNAVAFVLTTPFLGLGYYYIPKLVNRPIYSYKLSVLHFWSLIFIYMWAGPHHLQYTALPEWLQSLGVVFSIMLIAPSWGGAINFLATIKSAWGEMKSHPATKFFVAGSIFYLIATTEGPLMSLRSVNKLAHYTDWIIGHVHGGGLGWNGYLIFGMFYWLVPKLYKTQLYSKKLANLHFWISLVGIVLYMVSMDTAGIMTGLMRDTMTDGVLKYPNYMSILNQILPYYYVREIAGALFLIGLLIGSYVLIKTAQKAGKVGDTEATSANFEREIHNSKAFGSVQKTAESVGFILGTLAFFAVSIGGIVQIIPLLVSHSSQEPIATLKPYTPLELEGRDIYIREGCNNCHSQMIRTIKEEEMRYGPHSVSGEFEYDYPHLWGSKQTGPDLQKVGLKYSNIWHYKHFNEPRELTPNSIMPRYNWLITNTLDTSKTQTKLQVMASLGVPYKSQDVQGALVQLQQQQNTIAQDLMAQGEANVNANTEVIALIAYMQRLGVDGRHALNNKDQSKPSGE